ncbi:MAG TPA: hypothetical protein VFP39_07965 [Gemmatimonadales bacterium]|nr:hypothetical protein [Gemmatimonadales bacterium]
MLSSIRPVLRAIGVTVVPEAAQLDEQQWIALEAIVRGALIPRPRALQRQFILLVRAIEWLALLRYGRRFTALDATRRERLLAQLQNAPILLVRRGIWGLRTLLLMGYYGSADGGRAIGYRADPRGWNARG